MVVLVLIPALAAGGAAGGAAHGSLLVAAATALAKLAALVALVILAGSRVVPWLLLAVARLRSRELFTLTCWRSRWRWRVASSPLLRRVDGAGRVPGRHGGRPVGA